MIVQRKLAFLFVPILAVGGLAAEAAQTTPPADAAAGEWEQLFNGKDLTGWKVKIAKHELGDNFGDTFRVEDGILKVAYDKYENFNGQFGHLFYERPLSNYVLRVEYRFVGQQAPGGADWALRNSGVMIHGQTPESMGTDQNFPVSIEVQLLGGTGSGKRSTANVCTPGTNIVMDGKLVTQHCNNSTSDTFDGDQWVTVEIEVHGNKLIRHIVNGKTVLEYSEPQLDENDPDGKKLITDGNKMLSSGTISLQSESFPVEFRKIEVRMLDE